MFQIKIEKLYWVDKSDKNPHDLCLHGDITIKLDNQNYYEEESTLSAAALYLLKSLTKNHIAGKEIYLFPHCGHTIIPNEELDTVQIYGCDTGLDWTILHEKNHIRIVTEDRHEAQLDFKEYQKTVFDFADQIESYYKKNDPKIFFDEFDQKGYSAFWTEWNRLRN